MLVQHPLSAAFPAMDKMDFDALANDISKNGLHLPITMFEGMILDGWHRYRACFSVEAIPRFEELPEETDPVAFVYSRNLRRRDLTPSQKAAAVVACREWAKAGMNQHTELGGEPGSPPVATVPQMAKAADVSERTIQQAKVAHAAGLGDQVRDGKLTAKKAAELVRTSRPTPCVSLPPKNEPQSGLSLTRETQPFRQQRKRVLRWESARALLKAAMEQIKDSEDRDTAIEMVLNLLDEIDVCNP